MMRGLGKGLAALAMVCALVAGLAAGGLALARWREARAEAIRTPGGIDEAGFVRIGGLDQWVTIRGQDRTRPVLLILHGGPGGAISYLSRLMSPLERRYVVVQWDQPGAGKTLARAGGHVDPALDVATMVADGIAVADHARARLHRRRILLLGWSWGSDLGVRMAQARPDLFSTYVGTGQASPGGLALHQSFVRARLAAKMRAAGDAKALAALEAAGPPPWSPEASRTLWRVSGPYRGAEVPYPRLAAAALTAPHWGLADVQALNRGGAALKDTRLAREIVGDIPGFGQGLQVPVLVIQGADDTTTPTEPARLWFEAITPPAKAFVVLPGAGHQALITHTEAFAQAMEANLPGLLAKAGRGD